MHLSVRLWRRSEGATSVETAFALVLFFPFMIGLIEFARAYWNWNGLQLAAAQGARYAMINSSNGALATCTTPTPAPTVSGCAAVNPATLPVCAAAETSRQLIGFAASSVSISITCSGSPPAVMSVAATSTFNFVASTLLPYGPITLNGTATVPLM
jgi:Flp pilus assembly protein TadG